MCFGKMLEKVKYFSAMASCEFMLEIARWNYLKQHLSGNISLNVGSTRSNGGE